MEYENGFYDNYNILRPIKETAPWKENLPNLEAPLEYMTKNTMSPFDRRRSEMPDLVQRTITIYKPSLPDPQFFPMQDYQRIGYRLPELNPLMRPMPRQIFFGPMPTAI